MVRLTYSQQVGLDYSGGELRDVRFDWGSVCLTIGTVEVDVSVEELDEMLSDMELEAGFAHLSGLFDEHGYCPELLGYLEQVARLIVGQAKNSIAFGGYVRRRRAA